jgi:hypothetical protein
VTGRILALPSHSRGSVSVLTLRSGQSRWSTSAGADAASPSRLELVPSPRSETTRHVGVENAPRLQRELLEHRLHRHDVALEAELGVLEARGDADQLREVEDRHLEVLAGLLLELRLPGVE